jgi:hypothetical protein
MKLHMGSVHKNKVVFKLMKIVNLHPENLMKYVILLIKPDHRRATSEYIIQTTVLLRTTNYFREVLNCCINPCLF